MMDTSLHQSSHEMQKVASSRETSHMRSQGVSIFSITFMRK